MLSVNKVIMLPLNEVIIFASMFMREIDLLFSFLVVFLPSFGIRLMLGSKNSQRCIPSFSIFLGEFS